MTKWNEFTRPRIVPLMACLISVALCLTYAKFRSGLPDWWQSHGGGIPYVLFWILFVYTIAPKPRLIVRICVWVVVATCGLEILQLWNPEPLASFRATKFGAALLGSSFVWNDFPPYLLGGLVGYFILVCIARIDAADSA